MRRKADLFHAEEDLKDHLKKIEFLENEARQLRPNLTEEHWIKDENGKIITRDAKLILTMAKRK